jgi:hypothetical protein
MIYAYENYRNRRVTIHDGREAEAAVTGRQPTIRRCGNCLR